jgi:CubicO group peptidase (beta-lactamase class C family)
LDNRPQSLLNQFYEQLAAPLGLQNTVFEVDGDGIFVGSSYLFATARDWARMGWVMANEGRINQHQELPEWWVEQARTANSSQNDSRFGYQFWLNSGNGQLRWPELPVDTFAMQGSKKQRVMIFPQANAVIVRLGWSRSYPDDKNFSAILEALAKSP